MEKRVSLNVKCPLCGKSLMDNDKFINGKPAVKLNITTEENRGVVWLCSFYDCHDKELSIEVPEGEIVSFYCPHCNQELNMDHQCEICEAPMVSLVIKAGGIVTVCSRNGCTNHHVIFKDISSELSKFYSEYGF